MSSRILIFAPCAKWIVHHQLDCVLGAALVNRGCDVRVIACDGLFETCMVKGHPPQEALCQECQRFSQEWFSRFQLPVTQLSDLLTVEDHAVARKWTESVDVSRFEHANFEGMGIGRWCQWNLHGDLCVGSLDYSDPSVARRARDFALHCALIALATRRMLGEFKPDRAICFNGSMSYYRAFFELCQRGGVRTLVHERGFTDGSFVFYDNLTTYQRNLELQPAWTEHWRQVPLNADQWHKVSDLFASREKGGGMNFQEVHRFRSEAALTRKRLRLPPNARILLVLASGDWEFGMFKSYGGLGVFWDTQLEWFEETARHCAEHGWYMVVRHHPLGAGKKTYPRASKFLAQLIAHQGKWGSHVRVVMPGENLNTYDLMRISSVAVSQFTTGGAEALVRGLPVVCVAASAYRHMGMDWVRASEDYAPALVRAMNQELPINEAALTQAFRYANFHFYTMGSTTFNSVGIKETYRPDFRLNSPDDLQPGVDPRLDQICDFILSGSPLYPLPEGQGSDEDEKRLASELRTTLLAQRAALKGDKTEPSKPNVNVWRLGAELKRGQKEFPAPDGWRCRHQEVTMDWMVLDARGGANAMRLTLSKHAEDVSSPYVYLLPGHIELDESAISQCVDLLEKPENSDKTGVLLGCYSIDQNDSQLLGPEWNTPVHPAEATNLPPTNIPAVSDPMTVLSLVVWRREKLAIWLDSALPKHDCDDSWCHNMLVSFLDSSRFLNLAEPLVFIHSGESSEQMIAQADRLAEEGDLDGALKIAAVHQEKFGFINGLRTHMASWLVKHERAVQAVPLLYSEYRNGKPTTQSMEILQAVLPPLSIKRPRYKDYHSAVDSVFGYMVPGQERFLHEKVLSLSQDARVIEIGAFYGRSTTAMAFACAGTRRRILSVDTFSGNEGLMGRTSWFYNNWRGNLRRWGLEPYVSARPGYSHPVIRDLTPDEMFDFAFIDASHEYADVLLDFELIYPHVRPGGWIGFHDVEIGWPGCWRVWEQTGKRLLTDLAACDTLACGRKQADVAWRSFEDEWPGFMISVAQYLSADESRRDIGKAMFALFEGKASTADERIISQAPESLKRQLQNAIPEAGDDAWLHKTLQLMQSQDTAKQSAAS